MLSFLFMKKKGGMGRDGGRKEDERMRDMREVRGDGAAEKLEGKV